MCIVVEKSLCSKVIMISSFQAGLFIDKGVKTTNASAADPREYLCLDNSARCVQSKQHFTIREE